MSQEVEKVEDIACIDLNISLVTATSQNQEERILLPASVDQEETEGESVEVEETEEGGEIRDYSVVWGRVGSWPWWPPAPPTPRVWPWCWSGARWRRSGYLQCVDVGILTTVCRTMSPLIMS